jgi:hypothetical protein
LVAVYSTLFFVYAYFQPVIVEFQDYLDLKMCVIHTPYFLSSFLNSSFLDFALQYNISNENRFNSY